MASFKHILLFLFLLSGTLIRAQNDTIYTQLKCSVIDFKTKKPIDLATITLTKNNFKKQVLTNEDGVYLFDSLLQGNYTIFISATKYNKGSTFDIKIGNPEPFKVLINNKLWFKLTQWQYPLTRKNDEPTHDNFNSRQIMRMPY